MEVFLVFFILMFAMATHVFSSFFLLFCKCFRYTLQAFQLFRTHVANVSSECYKSRLGVAHVAMRVRNGGGASGACAAKPAWACEMQVRAGCVLA
jgi:hypothetical protein